MPSHYLPSPNAQRDAMQCLFVERCWRMAGTAQVQRKYAASR